MGGGNSSSYSFLGPSGKEQIAVLPILEERKYDFPDGDLITSNPLEILVSGYKACLNSRLTATNPVAYFWCKWRELCARKG